MGKIACAATTREICSGAASVARRSPTIAPTSCTTCGSCSRFATKSLVGEHAQRLCRLLVREAWRPSDALPDISETFCNPYEEHVTAVIARLAPHLDEAARRHHARSLVGQLLFPTFFRPFIELSEGVAVDDQAFLGPHADHVARVTLRALEVPPSRIDRAFEEASR